MANTTRVLIIDDHELLRKGLKDLLCHQLRYDCVGEAGTAAAGYDLAESLKPDLVILDIGLPDASGIQLTRKIKNAVPEIKVLILSMYDGNEHLTAAFDAGAAGYVLKESATENLLKGMDRVMRDDFYVDPTLAERMTHNLLNLSERKAWNKDEAYASLTPREREIMRLVADGLYTKEIAERLSISRKTVENHRANLMRKLGVRNATELVRYAASLGLVDVGGNE